MLTNEPFWRPYIWKSIFFFWLNFVKNLENNFCQKSKIYISGWLWDGDNKTLTTMSGTYDVYKWTEGGWYLQKHKWEVVKYEKIILQRFQCSLSDFDVKCIRFTFSGEMPYFFSSSESSFSSLFSQATVSSFWTPPDALVWFCFQISVVFRSRSSITAVYSLFFRLKRTSIRIWNIPLKKKNSETAKHKKHFQTCRFEISIWFE